MRYKKFLESIVQFELSESDFRELEEACSEILSNANILRDIMTNWSDESNDIDFKFDKWIDLNFIQGGLSGKYSKYQKSTGFYTKEESGELIIDRNEMSNNQFEAIIHLLKDKQPNHYGDCKIVAGFIIDLGYDHFYMITPEEKKIVDKIEEEIKSRFPLVDINRTKNRSTRTTFNYLEIKIPL